MCNVNKLTYINNLENSQIAYRKSKTIDSDFFVLYVWMRICEIMADKIEISDICTEQLMRLGAELSKLEEKRNSAQNRLVNMYKDKLDGLISDGDYKLFRQKLTDEEQAICIRINDIAVQINECRQRVKDDKEKWTVIEQYTHFDKLDRTIAEEFIDCVKIGMPDDKGNREIHIYWKI